ncbi:Polyprenyl synthetase [Methanocaldococcus villosus KIN24-T80]|uniref:Polyprenyl synthetase n=1 Tax=Methanocaldococcus villosus KIN24-T80 TaxID=1069083 RepID=N6UVE8_9EURY|nr:polyprenyl synthetase family protein [Methanocaldococcus villosus]ENN96329.1 Polyprenyl synthetase [Methanocaldococcus villosus KIN24-T80]
MDREILSLIDEELKKYVNKNNKLYSAANHLLLSGGKRLRPYLCVLVYKLKKDNLSEVLPAAVSVELIHNYTLIHDDIMDNDDLRRGKPTVHKVYGNAMAILAGDLLYAKAFEAVANIKDNRKAHEVLKILADACVYVCEGQAMDMEFEEKDSVSLEEYLDMIRKKTGALIEAAAKIGAVMGDFNDEEMKAIEKYAENIGLTFQIQDDVLDLIADEEKLGKPVGSDIREGKKTIIIIHALSTLEEDKKNRLKSLLGKKDITKEEIGEAIEILRPSIEYAKNLMENKTIEAIDALKIFDKDRRKPLEDLAKFIISRCY